MPSAVSILGSLSTQCDAFFSVATQSIGASTYENMGMRVSFVTCVTEGTDSETTVFLWPQRHEIRFHILTMPETIKAPPHLLH